MFICKNCQKHSLNSYYGFCSVSCASHYAVKNGLTLNSVKEDSIESIIEEINDKYEQKIWTY